MSDVEKMREAIVCAIDGAEYYEASSSEWVARAICEAGGVTSERVKGFEWYADYVTFHNEDREDLLALVRFLRNLLALAGLEE